jgi:S-adenosylmethionine:tRNA ribosyltransferase-isomerase
MDPRTLRITDHTYELPEDRIALHPLPERDASKLLVYQAGAIADTHFRDLAEHIPPGALLVLNDTRVVNARVLLRRATGALVEFMLMDPADGGPMESALGERGESRWWCLVGNARRWKGEALHARQAGMELEAVREEQEPGRQLVRFRWGGDHTFSEVLQAFGAVPLPPYMHRGAEPEDSARYNTVFAEHEGSVAAPTASLHFTPRVLEALRAKGVQLAYVTLHVGAGTYLPVKSERMEGHVMHGEQVRLPLATIKALHAALGKRPIIAVGTTALRTIESLCWYADDRLAGVEGPMHVDQWRPYERPAQDTAAGLAALIADMERTMTRALYGSTDLLIGALITGMERTGSRELEGRTSLLIAPGYAVRLADGLITNFHQPQSTLLLLVSAFIGDAWRQVYAHAIDHGYRFLSYGDGSLLWRKPREGRP